MVSCFTVVWLRNHVWPCAQKLLVIFILNWILNWGRNIGPELYIFIWLARQGDGQTRRGWKEEYDEGEMKGVLCYDELKHHFPLSPLCPFASTLPVFLISDCLLCLLEPRAWKGVRQLCAWELSNLLLRNKEWIPLPLVSLCSKHLKSL